MFKRCHGTISKRRGRVNHVATLFRERLRNTALGVREEIDGGLCLCPVGVLFLNDPAIDGGL